MLPQWLLANQLLSRWGLLAPPWLVLVEVRAAVGTPPRRERNDLNEQVPRPSRWADVRNGHHAPEVNRDAVEELVLLAAAVLALSAVLTGPAGAHPEGASAPCRTTGARAPEHEGACR